MHIHTCTHTCVSIYIYMYTRNYVRATRALRFVFSLGAQQRVPFVVAGEWGEACSPALPVAQNGIIAHANFTLHEPVVSCGWTGGGEGRARSCQYIYVYTYIETCISLYIHIYIYIEIEQQTYAYIHTCTCMHIYVCMHR